MEPAQHVLGNLWPDFVAVGQSQLLSAALAQFSIFSLVVVRMSGLMLVGPLLGQSAVPAQVRVLIVMTCSFLITPALPNQAQRAFAEFDQNRDGRLTKAEVPESLHHRFEDLNQQLEKPKDFPITQSEWRYRFEAPQSLLGWGVLAVRELSFGFVLGLGLSIVFSGLQLAGELIDQQTGIGFERDL